MSIFLQVIYYEITRISTLSNQEFVGIVAGFHRIGEKSFDETRYKKEQLAAMRAAEKFSAVDTLGMRFLVPFRNFDCGKFDFYTTLFGAFNRHGTLPFPGCLTEQPALIIEVFNTLKALIAERAEAEEKKAQGSSGAGQRQSQSRNRNKGRGAGPRKA